MLTYRRGTGWVEEPDHIYKTYIAERGGKRYRVTIYDHGLADGEIGRTTYARDVLPKWFSEWEGIPAGFGGGDFGPTMYNWKVVTEEC